MLPRPAFGFLLAASALVCVVLGGCQRTGAPVVGAGTEGERVYRSLCQTCHGAAGQGVARAFPPLAGAAWATGDEGRAVRIVLHGMSGEIVRGGVTYDGLMPAQGHLSDDEVAAVLTFMRANFGNTAPAISPSTVAAVRAAEARRRGVWTASELETATGVPGSNAPGSNSNAPGSNPPGSNSNAPGSK